MAGVTLATRIQPRLPRKCSEARQVAIYAARRLAGKDLHTIGRYFGMSYPVVSRRVQAVETVLQHDRSLRTRVEGVLRPLMLK